MTRPEDTLTRAIEEAERDPHGGKVMLSVEYAKRLRAMVERPEMHEDPAHRARSFQNIAYQLREYPEQRHQDESGTRPLNWTFDGESYHAGRYRIDPTPGDADQAIHHIYVDGEYSSSCPGLNRAKGWCVLQARHLDAKGFSGREWLKLAAAAVLLIIGIAVWGWLG